MLLKPGKSDRVYTPTKLAAIIDALSWRCLPCSSALGRVSPAELLSPDTCVSVPSWVDVSGAECP
jgi:hypothetical protein